MSSVEPRGRCPRDTDKLLMDPNSELTPADHCPRSRLSLPSQISRPFAGVRAEGFVHHAHGNDRFGARPRRPVDSWTAHGGAEGRSLAQGPRSRRAPGAPTPGRGPRAFPPLNQRRGAVPPRPLQHQAHRIISALTSRQSQSKRSSPVCTAARTKLLRDNAAIEREKAISGHEGRLEQYAYMAAS